MAKELFKFALGAKVKDTITGYTGIIAGRTEYLTGCVQYGLQKEGLTKEGYVFGWQWFDESRLELIYSKAAEIDKGAGPGGPAPFAPEC